MIKFNRPLDIFNYRQEKISVEEYKKALEIVTLFHEQVFNEASNVKDYIVNKNGTELLVDILLKENNVRLFNSVKCSNELNNWLALSKINFEECTIEGFLSFIKQQGKTYAPNGYFRGIGKKTFKDFIDKHGKFDDAEENNLKIGEQ